MGVIKKYIFKKGLKTKPTTGPLESNVEITCGQATVTGTLLWQNHLYGISNGQATVTGTLNAVTETEGVSNGVATVTGILGNGSFYEYSFYGIIINDPDEAGEIVDKVNYYNMWTGVVYFGSEVTLQVPQPSFFNRIDLDSTMVNAPDLMALVYTIIRRIPNGIATLGHNIVDGHKFHYLITDQEYTALDLVDILDNMQELPTLYDGTNEYAEFVFLPYTDGTRTHIYIIHDYRSNSNSLSGNINGQSQVSGILTAKGSLSGVSNSFSDLNSSLLTGLNIFFGGISSNYNTLETLANEISNPTRNAQWFINNTIRFGVQVPHGNWRYLQEVAIQINSSGAMFYTDSFIDNEPLKYFIDVLGMVNNFGQGAFHNLTQLERLHLPGAIHLAGPSGYFTLQGLLSLKGHIILPALTGEVGNMNHVFNDAKNVTKIYMPSLTRIQLQLVSRYCFSNMNSLERVYMPLCETLIQASGDNFRIFRNIPSGTVMYLHPSLETSDGGNRAPEVIYWEDDRGAEIRYVNSFVAPNTPTSINATNITGQTFDLNIVDPNPLPAGGFYEVWVDNGYDMWQMFTSWQEVIASGETVSGLDYGATYKVKIRKADELMNYSDFTSEITVQLTSSSAESISIATVSGTLSHGLNIGELEGQSNGSSFAEATTIESLQYPATLQTDEIDWTNDWIYADVQPDGIEYPPYRAYITDPETGAKIFRIGDQIAFSTTGNQVQHNYASNAAWNCNETLIKLNAPNQRIINAHDGSIWGVVSAPSYHQWSNLLPDKMYGISGNNVNEFVIFDINTNIRTTLRTFNNYTNVSIGSGEGRLSFDDRYVCLTGRRNGNNNWLITYDVLNNIVIAELELPTGDLDFATISESGTYVIVSWRNDGNGSNEGFKIYDRNLNFLFHATDYTGHGDCGYDEDGNEVFVQFRNASESYAATNYYIEMIDLATGVVYGLWYDNPNPSPRGIWGGHISCRNTDRPGWCYISEGNASNNVARNMIVALKLSRTDTNTIEIYGRHHSRAQVNYQHEAHAVPNRSGTKILFKTNWYSATLESWSAAPSCLLEWPQT